MTQPVPVTLTDIQIALNEGNIEVARENAHEVLKQAEELSQTFSKETVDALMRDLNIDASRFLER